MEFWQFCVTIAALVYILERIGTAVRNARQLQLRKKLVALNQQIASARDQIQPTVEIWWQETGQQQAAKHIDQEVSDLPEPVRQLQAYELEQTIARAISHYALDLQTREIHEQIATCHQQLAETPEDQHDASSYSTEYNKHIEAHELDLMRFGFNLEDLTKAFSPSSR